MIVKGEDIPFRDEWAELKKNYLLEESEDMMIEYLSANGREKYKCRNKIERFFASRFLYPASIFSWL